jgi:hypothetical protein
MVPVGQQTQHRGVIDRGDLAEPRVAQRDDRRCSGVVRICAVGAAGVEQPHPGREGRGHIQHGLAGGDELLGQ